MNAREESARIRGELPSAERVRSLLDYDPESGLFTWKVTTTNRVKKGDVAGFDRGDGYILTSIDGFKCRAHRLVWLYCTGEWPENEIDHIDGNPSNNRIENLREATHGQNIQNIRKAIKRDGRASPLMGATWAKKEGRWKAQIRVCGKNKHLGYFDTDTEASKAYLSAKSDLHPFQTIEVDK